MDYERGDEVVALFDYCGSDDDEELCIKKFEKLTVREDESTYWLKVKNPKTGSKGFVPKNHVAPADSLQCEDWFFGKISSRKAKKWLMKSKYPKGTFLVRESESFPSNYVLCIKSGNSNQGYHVCNIRIQPYGEHSFCIGNEEKKFDDLKELMEYYMVKGEIAGKKLAEPCTKKKPSIYDSRANRVTSKQDNWEIPFKDITMDEKLGEGAFGVVFAGTWRNNTKIAVKTMVESSFSSLEDFHQEAKIMKTLVHPHILTLLGVSRSPSDGKILIVTEYMKLGSLISVLKVPKFNFERCDLLQFSKQVADGMAYLERKNYIHRDLAARNVLVDEDFDVKISDFGLSRIINADIYKSRTGICPRRWSAPEALQNRLFSTKSDVWSYGILLYEIFSLGELPYSELSDSDDVLDVIKTGYRLPRPKRADEEVYNVMKKCWKWDANERPDFKKICNKMESLCEEESSSSSDTEDGDD